MNIKDDPNSQSSPAVQTQLQEDARTMVVDGTPRITPWQPMPVTADPNSNVKSKPDVKTNPGQGFVKRPDMPKPANLKDIKVNL
jgi:hypothetical protein